MVRSSVGRDLSRPRLIHLPVKGLLTQIRNGNTPVVVERIVADIDEIVRVVRFPGWQQTIQGEREVRKALRKTLLKYKLHQEQEPFDRAYAYIAQYY
jgi:type I restriction enzyme, R subunit